MENKTFVTIGITTLLFVVIGGWFYWYEYRPTTIVSDCSSEAQDNAIEKRADSGETDGKFNADDRDRYYKWCLQKNGID